MSTAVATCHSLGPALDWVCTRPDGHAGMHMAADLKSVWPNVLMPKRKATDALSIAIAADRGDFDHLYRKAAVEDKGSDSHLTEYTRGFRAGLQQAAFETYLVGCPD